MQVGMTRGLQGCIGRVPCFTWIGILLQPLYIIKAYWKTKQQYSNPGLCFQFISVSILFSSFYQLSCRAVPPRMLPQMLS